MCVCVCVCVSDELGRRGGLQQLMESRDMSASRASLSILDDESDNHSLHHHSADDDDEVVVDDDGQCGNNHRSSRHVRQNFVINSSYKALSQLMHHRAVLSSYSSVFCCHFIILHLT